MAVSNYIPYGCQYKIDKLDNVVYIVAKNEIGGIHIDNGDAYVDGVGYYNAIDCLSVSLSENESLDERYEFVHTVNFSVRGYLKIHDLNDYYIMLRDKNDTYWLVNPYFKIKYTYTYTLDYNSNHTDYVASAKSNFPLLQVKNFTANNVKPCNAYDYCGTDVLAINEAAYSKYSNDKVIYTNDGFSVVKYQKNSCVFTEQYDGSSLSHTVKFNISFDDYKSSWHYNLLEFTDNNYAAVISTKCGVNIACGFDDGLQPSYTVTANDSQSINNIEIVLSDIHSTEVLLNMPSELPFEHDSGTTWNNVQGEYTCIDSTTAVYTLRQEYDIFGNALNNYMCLEGFEDRYASYHIVGTFTDEVSFYCPQCRAEECTLQTSFPSNLTFYTTGCKTFSIRSTSDFTIESNTPYITVSPSAGTANQSYSVTVCNSQTPTSTANTYHLTVTYCSGLTKIYDATVVTEPVIGCLPQGSEYNISVYAQDVTIPTNCCIKSVSASCCVSNIQIQNGYVKFRVDTNDTGSERTITLTFIKCDNTTVTANVMQAHYYSQWVYEGRQCHENQMCALDRMYSGETQDNINTPTYITRYRDCEPSSTCSQAQYKWENMNPSEGYYCNDCQAQYKWENMNPNEGYYCNDCSAEPQYRWINLDLTYNYYCEGTTKYYKQQQQISVDGGQTWENVSPAQYRRGESAQTQSSDCGYIPTIKYKWENMNPSTDYYCLDCQPAMYEWRRITPISGDSSTFVCDVCCVNQYRWVDLDPTVDYYCSGTTKYYKQQKQVSIDCGESWDWVSPAEYQWGGTAQTQSTDCGYVPPTPTTPITYYSPSKLDVDLTRFTPAATGHSFNDGVGTIEFAEAVKSIHFHAFHGKNIMTAIEIPDSVTEIGAYAFSSCTSLTSIDIPNGVTSIEFLAFANCTSLTSITIPNSVTFIGGGAFNNTPWWRSYSADRNNHYGNIVYINDIAYKATATSITSVSFREGTVSIGDNAFSSCDRLTSVDIPNSVTKIGNDAFYCCTSLTSVNIPSGVTSIDIRTFQGCTSLTSIDIPNGVTSINGWYAFQGCTSLSSVTIPSGVTFIDDYAFENCRGLTSVTVNATTPPALGRDVFYDTNNCPIYVPAASVDAYKSASGWSAYASRIQAIQ